MAYGTGPAGFQAWPDIWRLGEEVGVKPMTTRKSSSGRRWRAALLGPLWLGSALAEKRPSVGGQAVIEGVMMRAPGAWAVAVRAPGGQSRIQTTPYRGWAAKYPLLAKPVLRGAVMLLESLILGFKALNYSADQAAQADTELKEAETGPAGGGQAADKPGGGLGFWALAGTLAFSLALAVGLFVALPHLLTAWAGSYWGFGDTSPWFHLIDGLIKFIFFVAYVGLIGLMPDIRAVYGYHGAEHQAIYAFEAGDELTVASARKYQPLHPRCGTSFIFLVLAISIFFFAAVFPLFMPQTGSGPWRWILGIGLKILSMFPLAGLAYEVTRLAGRAGPGSIWRVLTWPGLMLQKLTTRPPDDRQLEIALLSLASALNPPPTES